MNAVTPRHAGDDPEPHHTSREATADRQQPPTSGFDARARLQGEFDDTTVRQAVLGATPRGDTAHHDTAGSPPAATH